MEETSPDCILKHFSGDFLWRRFPESIFDADYGNNFHFYLKHKYVFFSIF